MEKKYLPIGTVCSLKGKNKKTMIIGYYSVKFNGNLKINDYYGCSYPEGLLIPDQILSFNHTDIEKIEFVGYVDENQRKFMDIFNSVTGNISEEEKAAKFHKKEDMILTSNESYSKLLFDENGVVMIAEKKENSSNENIEKYKFDENGTVIAINNNEKVNNPFVQDYSSSSNKKAKKKTNIFSNIKFDENGTVVEDNSVDNKKNMINDIVFDKNGTVIQVGKAELEHMGNVSKYKFDENGTLIAVDEPNKKIEKYKFDENGTVVAVD